MCSFWIVPASTFAFGVITLATAFINNRGGFFAMRILLGLTECFTMPANAYLLSRYYRRHELATRIASFMLLAAGISQAFAGLLSSGFLSVPPVGNFDSAWRNIFLVRSNSLPFILRLIVILVYFRAKASSPWVWLLPCSSSTRPTRRRLASSILLNELYGSSATRSTSLR